MFPYAILIGYGVLYRIRYTKIVGTQKGPLGLYSLSMLLYGTSMFPIDMRPRLYLDYTTQFSQLADGAIIDLPMGRNESKFYMGAQTDHQRPIIEGMIARTPPDAYDYIDSNTLLRIIRGIDTPGCIRNKRRDWYGRNHGNNCMRMAFAMSLFTKTLQMVHLILSH